MKRTYHSFLFAVIFFVSSCIVFNEEQENKGPFLAKSPLDFDIRSNSIDKKESLIGNLVADAIFQISTQECRKKSDFLCPDFSMINAGSIRQKYFYTRRDKIFSGNIYKADIQQLLPFYDEIVIVKLSVQDIKLALERSVSHLASTGENGKSPFFLSVSGIAFSVDCARETQRISHQRHQIMHPGNRIQDIFLTKSPSSIPLIEDTYYNVATTRFLADGNDGFLAFVQRQSNGLALVSENHFLGKYNEANILKNDDALPVSYEQSVVRYLQSFTLQGRELVRPETGRIKLHANCLSAGG